jgi:hypothetical protein
LELLLTPHILVIKRKESQPRIINSLVSDGVSL